LDTAIRLCQSTPKSSAIDTTSERRRLANLADDIRLGPSSLAILRAASARGIPFHRLNRGSLVQLGEGAYQRRIWTAETDATSAIAESIASDKQLTRSMLAAVGVNVPKGRSVVDREDAWRAAQEIGLPVAVKPRNGNHAVGVSLDLGDRDSIMTAYDWACDVGTTKDVLVEQYIVGDHHRLLVIGGKLVAAARGQREYIVGDGVRSVTELVDELNRDPRRGENYTDLLDIVNLNESAAIVLSKQGLTFDSIPALNQKVLIRHVGDLIEDCTDDVHPSTRNAAVLAAKTIGLDIAGMDLVASDISKPLNDQRGCIIEVNAGPSLGPHVAPLIGSPQPVGEAVVDLLFDAGSQSTIPTILIFNESSTTSNLSYPIANELVKLGFEVGFAHESNRPVDSQSNPDANIAVLSITRDLAQFNDLLMHPFLTAILMECSSDRIAQEGLPCTHTEFVVIPESSFDDVAVDDFSSAIAAALDTLKLLLSQQGCLIIYGNRSLHRNRIDRIFASIAPRLQYVADEGQVADLIRSRCHTKNSIAAKSSIS
jgi:cyanophycin synthetase